MFENQRKRFQVLPKLTRDIMILSLPAEPSAFLGKGKLAFDKDAMSIIEAVGLTIDPDFPDPQDKDFKGLELYRVNEALWGEPVANKAGWEKVYKTETGGVAILLVYRGGDDPRSSMASPIVHLVFSVNVVDLG